MVMKIVENKIKTKQSMVP